MTSGGGCRGLELPAGPVVEVAGSGVSRGPSHTYPYVGEACEISRAVTVVAALNARRRWAMYRWAVALGVANTQCTSERERRFGALRLLTLALTRASASTAKEPTRVPRQIAAALRHLLAIYLIGREIASAA